MALNSLGELENTPGAYHREQAAHKRAQLIAHGEAVIENRKAAQAFYNASRNERRFADECYKDIYCYFRLPPGWLGDFNLDATDKRMETHRAQSAAHEISMAESLKLAREYNSFSKNMGLKLQIIGHDVTAAVQSTLGFIFK